MAETAQRVVVMYAGRKVEQAPIDVLFDQPLHAVGGTHMSEHPISPGSLTAQAGRGFPASHPISSAIEADLEASPAQTTTPI